MNLMNHVLSLTLFAALLLSGCSGGALKRSFNGFSSVYAETVNHQMLLNLARVRNGHPPYFMQMGQINATYSFARNLGAVIASAGAAPSFTSESRQFSVGASVAEQPTLSWTPLNGAAFTEAIFTPMSSTMLYALIEQGYPADVLFRLMVHSLEYTVNGERHIFRNTLDPSHTEAFSDFLTLCAIARELQKADCMRVEVESKILPIDGPSIASVTVTEAASVAEKGLFLKKKEEEGEKGGYHLTKTVAAPHLKVERKAREIIKKLEKDPSYRMETYNGESLWCAAQESGQLVIRMRPFIGMLQAAAEEADLFDAAVAKSPKHRFWENLPPSERNPILRINWSHSSERTHPALVSLDYFGKKYQITDPVVTPKDIDKAYFRDVFTLINHLFSQVLLDPSKIPVQQTIRVN